MDAKKAFFDALSTPFHRRNTFEHTSLTPSRKPISGHPRVLPTCPGRRPSNTGGRMPVMQSILP